jgi:virginiamycin B lyase
MGRARDGTAFRPPTRLLYDDMGPALFGAHCNRYLSYPILITAGVLSCLMGETTIPHRIHDLALLLCVVLRWMDSIGAVTLAATAIATKLIVTRSMSRTAISLGIDSSGGARLTCSKAVGGSLAWLLVTCRLLFLIPGAIAVLISEPEQLSAQTITEFLVPTQGSQPAGITVGPDGALWFTESSGVSQIGRIATSGTITEFAVPTRQSAILDITLGPDGALWFTEFEGNRIGRMATDGTVTEFTLPIANSTPQGVTLGPDGAVWFTERRAGNKIGRITNAGVITEFLIPTPNADPINITAGPDGALWFTEASANQIGRITIGGAITEFVVPTPAGTPIDITTGPDGALWFTETNANKIGRVTTAGVFTEFMVPSARSSPWAITAGPDGALWFTELGANQVARITTNGVVTEFPIPTFNASPIGIITGPDGAMWFTEDSGNKIGRITTPASPWCILGDINCDGIVDVRDYGIWRQNFGQTNCGNVADLNGDCIVDTRDYGLWRQNFGHMAGPAVARAVPPAAPLLGTTTPAPMLTGLKRHDDAILARRRNLAWGPRQERTLQGAVGRSPGSVRRSCRPS